MKKTILMIIVASIALAMSATPLIGMVIADPAQGQKVPITLIWTQTQLTTIERNDTASGVSHRHIHVWYNIQLTIDNTATLSGTAFAERDNVVRPPQDGFLYGDRVLRDYYVLSFPSEGGGFEGNAILQLTDYTSLTVYNAMTHGLFHGTGAFEGQTINAGRDWGPAGQTATWTGYLLKS
ncbi:MAG TPA: hypothetical protein VK209_01665 [Candidatus Sulfotelmatobacter sp.]|nr:hypothetical protein [Candidatus Sulfotelmatobacter sp.]